MTQNYFPTFDCVRSSTVITVELRFCRLLSLAGECRDWPFCGLLADWLRTKIAYVPALSPREPGITLSTRISRPAAAQAPER